MNWNGGNNNGGGFPPPQQQQPPQQQTRYAPPQGFGGGSSPFGGLNEADPTGQRLPYFEKGNYLVVIDSIKFKEARSGKSFYIIETTIEWSDCPTRPTGSQAACMIDMSNKDMRGVNLKRFIAAAMGSEPELDIHKGPNAPDGRPWDVVAMDSCSDRQPCVGIRVALTVVETTTKQGKDFTVHLWHPATAPSPQTQQAPQAQPNFGQQPQPNFAPQQQPNFGQQPQPSFNPQAQPQQHPQPSFNPQAQPNFAPQQQPNFAPQPQQQPNFNPQTQPQQQPQPGFGPPNQGSGWNPPR